MNEMKIFTNAEFGEVRTFELNGKPYFAGTDIAKALGYSNPRDAIARHCKGVVKHDGVSTTINQYGTVTNQSVLISFISEGDLYRLIIGSKLPSAEKFERWVFDEVLPSIRRNGMYAMDELIENPDLAINALMALKEERARRKALEVDMKIKEQQIAELQPKASYYDVILQCKNLLSMTEIAKDYGMSAKGMNKKLHDLGIQFNQGGVWFLYAKYQDKGYTQTKTQNYNKPDGTQGAKTHMYWTQKGRLFLYERLKQSNLLPVIERENVA